MKRVHIHITGKVQGVGFRHFTVQNARRLGVSGWVKNLSDGRVEGVFEGDETDVDTLVDRCREGPRAAQVEEVEMKEENESARDSFSSFSVRYG